MVVEHSSFIDSGSGTSLDSLKPSCTCGESGKKIQMVDAVVLNNGTMSNGCTHPIWHCDKCGNTFGGENS